MLGGTGLHEFPQFLFSCRALVDLTLAVEDRTSCLARCYISESGWDFPALVKLNLRNFKLVGGRNKRINLFSKCVNLKDLTLREIDTCGLEEINLCVPQLSNLSVTFRYRYSYPKVPNPKVLNMVGHQLQNLTASVDSIDVLHCLNLLSKSAEGFDSLKKVNLSWPEINHVPEKTRLSQLFGVFQKLNSAKFLILDPHIIKVLSSRLDLLLVEPGPFNNLKCLKMNTMLETRYVCRPTKREHVVVPIQLKNYFLDKSPSATFITDYPQNVHDDVMSEAETKVPDTILTHDEEMLDANIEIKDEVISEQEAMLKAKIQMQDEAITKQKAMFEARIHMMDQVILEQEEIFEGNIQMEDQVINEANAMLEAKIQMLDQAIIKLKTMFEAHIQMVDQFYIKQKENVVTRYKKAMFEDERQMQDQVMTKQKAVMFEAKIQMQDQVITKQKVIFAAEIKMLFQVHAIQKAMLEAILQMQNNIIAEKNAKKQMLHNEYAELKAKNQMLHNEKAELKARIQMQVQNS